MNLNLQNYTALVCGSSQGIGRAAATELAAMGARVVLLARSEEALKTTCSSLPTPNGQQHHYLAADFSNPTQVASVVDTFVKAGNPIHILINNTGGPPGGPIVNATTDAFLSTFNQHLICNHLIAQAVLPGMKDAGFGRIINIISTSVKQPLKGLGVSNTIRAAVANWSKTLSVEVAPFGITVNNVLPGATATQRLSSIIENKSQKQNHTIDEVEQEMLAEIPAGRFGKPEEIAAAVAFLASPSAAYINGINIPVDGGRTSCL
jgi:3-oxoacyl-[acyl-carrier protein] reductase